MVTKFYKEGIVGQHRQIYLNSGYISEDFKLYRWQTIKASQASHSLYMFEGTITAN